MKNKLTQAWYQPEQRWTKALLPLAWLYGQVSELRKKILLKKQAPFPLPIIVIGNISVGGTGKTPVVIAVAKLLREQGYKPAIISRGYGGNATQFPQPVDAKSDPSVVGDEPVLIATRTRCPVVVDPIRVNAALYAIQHYDCDVLLSDDGLQHYALPRQYEIAVIDGARGLGNGLLLPAGPLRESPARLNSVDAVLVNGRSTIRSLAEYAFFSLEPDGFWHIKSGEKKNIDDFKPQEGDAALAAIGNPQRFLATLKDIGLQPELIALADHHPIASSDIPTEASRVLMTEKDAVKCRYFDDERLWALSVSAVLPPTFCEHLLRALTPEKK